MSCGVCAFAALRWHKLFLDLQGRATLRAELGRGRHLLATTRAEPHEGHPAFGAEIGSLHILRATAWALHAACVLHSARQSKEKAYNLLSIGAEQYRSLGEVPLPEEK